MVTALAMAFDKLYWSVAEVVCGIKGHKWVRSGSERYCMECGRVEKKC